MLSDEALLGIRKPEPTELKPIKLKLPLRHVLMLHRLRIVHERTVSEIIAQAVNEYFEEHVGKRREPLDAPALLV